MYDWEKKKQNKQTKTEHDNQIFHIPNRCKKFQGLHAVFIPLIFVFLQVTAQNSPFLCLLLLTLTTVSSLK